MGVAAGYSSTRIYQMFNGDHHTLNTVITAIAFPGTIFAITFFLNFFFWAKGSSGAIPFTCVLTVMALWLFISVPLCYIGRRLALHQPRDVLGNFAEIPRQIPTQKWYLRYGFFTPLGGILSFGVIFIELYFILTSIWYQTYSVYFGFLPLVFLLLIITCAEVSIVWVYYQLNSENWHWWWCSFMASGSSALYMFLYCIFFFFTRLKFHGFISGVIYFGYTTIFCLFFFVLTGAIGFTASYYFVKTIYQDLSRSKESF